MRLARETHHEIVIERSRFICYLQRTTDEETARAFINQIRKFHPDASHHCTAMILGPNDQIQRSSDDGEPSGTAGVPMLQALRNNHMQDITAVTVRYFGGIKLGAGGLIRAYTRSVAEALHQAEKTEAVLVKVFEITFDYALIGKIDALLMRQQATLLNKSYAEQVTYQFSIPDSAIIQAIQEVSAGQAVITPLPDQVVEIPVV